MDLIVILIFWPYTLNKFSRTIYLSVCNCIITMNRLILNTSIGVNSFASVQDTNSDIYPQIDVVIFRFLWTITLYKSLFMWILMLQYALTRYYHGLLESVVLCTSQNWNFCYQPYKRLPPLYIMGFNSGAHWNPGLLLIPDVWRVSGRDLNSTQWC